MAEAKQSESIRMLKVIINREELSCAGIYEANGTWKQGKYLNTNIFVVFDNIDCAALYLNADYLQLIPACCDEKNACYLLFRLDTKTENGVSEWWLFSYVPDNSHPRQKMTNASTRATLRRDFGMSFITGDFFASQKVSGDSIVWKVTKNS